jgi:hypothetical protein
MPLTYTVDLEAGMTCYVLREGDSIVGVFHALPRVDGNHRLEVDDARHRMNKCALELWGLIPTLHSKSSFGG